MVLEWTFARPLREKLYNGSWPMFVPDDNTEPVEMGIRSWCDWHELKPEGLFECITLQKGQTVESIVNREEDRLLKEAATMGLRRMVGNELTIERHWMRSLMCKECQQKILIGHK